ncbi:hypothetical protein TNCV_371551 [Trichonephila clavipes]|nr:hypothetical protein TNCV_371551 [Trichonephila clavipes]
MGFGGLLLSLETFLVVRKISIHIKTISIFVEECDDERHVAVQPSTDRSRNTPPWQKRSAASITTCLRLRRAEAQISYSTPSTEPFPTPFPSLRTSL